MIMLTIYNEQLRINQQIETLFIDFHLINKKSLYYTYFFSFLFIKCKKYIDQKEQDKLAIQAGNKQNKAERSAEYIIFT